MSGPTLTLNGISFESAVASPGHGRSTLPSSSALPASSILCTGFFSMPPALTSHATNRSPVAFTFPLTTQYIAFQPLLAASLPSLQHWRLRVVQCGHDESGH
ncbi:hypothetical protein MSAN_00221600 [Mycena sanguinolenta]|uniref:Uncharacterized protein n=1 Tax=Mycena sanguinolenta TaxID=230812 RepID=A0A8H6ZIF8_9AGAR|nr:hypothetical protein MSAN_00221600 [Mycena sanguinolenta]